MQYWEDASLSVLKEIYSIDELLIEDISPIREHLDAIIDNMWVPVDGDTLRVRHAWKTFGILSRHLGKNLGFAIFESSPDPVHEIVCRKQRDYGHNNISRFGRQGLMVRLHDKVARLENLLSSGRRPNNESIEDNIVDLVGYSCIAMMWEDETFLLACNTSTVAESTRFTSQVARSMDDVFTKNGLITSL